MWCLRERQFRQATALESTKRCTNFLGKSFSSLQRAAGFGFMPAVKFAASLFLLCAFALTACNTLATRRSFYRQNKGSGPYTRQLKEGITPKPQEINRPPGTPSPSENSSS